VTAAGIRIHAQAVVPVLHDVPYRYLGVHCCFNGTWDAQQLRSYAMIQLFTRLLSFDFPFRICFDFPCAKTSTYISFFFFKCWGLVLRFIHFEN
jgi:hypothetical protein